jgi:2-C-methyl-D-erythritol 2,4-cyclodiphosphate synthase
MRVGIGIDVHRLVEGRRLILGGVDVPFSRGLLGHSDADVLSHAICDALLGAAALGNIGLLFPDDQERYKDICSLELLKEVGEVLLAEGFVINNIDAVVVAQRPRLAPYIEEMRENIAKALNISVDVVSIKATTSEGLGYEGSGEGISAHSVVSLKIR